MARKARKPKPASDQLDLFATPLPSAQASIGASVVAANPCALRDEAAAERRPVVDPLHQRAEADVRRGRPPKIVKTVALSGVTTGRLMDVREAAAWLGLSKSTLNKMRCYGNGPHFIRAACRAIRYDPADLQAFANERRRSST